MKFEYFKDTDTLYIDLQETPSVESKEISEGVVIDYNEHGQVVGIEIDNAKKNANLNRFETKSLPINDLVLSWSFWYFKISKIFSPLMLA